MNFKKVVTLDIECYENYFLAMFYRPFDGKVKYFEMFNDNKPLDKSSILSILQNNTIVTFNGNNYDVPMIEAACEGYNNANLKYFSDAIIQNKLMPWEFRREFNIKRIYNINHIDLINVAPLKGSLKVYAGRLHADKMQDLPLQPDAIIKRSHVKPMRKYCLNDNKNTALLFKNLKGEIELREQMSEDYNVDLRSKSDAQISETIIKHELKTKYDLEITAPFIDVGTEYYYKAPEFIKFKSKQLNDLLDVMQTNSFQVDASGHMKMKTGKFKVDENGQIRKDKNGKAMPLPHALTGKKVQIGKMKYKVGLGGLHSTEKTTTHRSGDEYKLFDYDVKSFYPKIILICQYFPKHIGRAFLKIYESLVNRRLKAKAEGNHRVAQSLKIAINGLFGKLGSLFSAIYSPDLMMQVTLTGQLSLLMLIEMLESKSVEVVSGNTDGIVLKQKPGQRKLINKIVTAWEKRTGFELENTPYKILASRDVNNYVAVTTDNKVKAIGAFADPHSEKNKLQKNPQYEICNEAIWEFLKTGTPIEATIKQCKDIHKFTSMRTVNNIAVHEGEEIGKVVRWYHSRNELDCFRCKKGNKVPFTTGAKPLMDLPDRFPDDVDYEFYIEIAINGLQTLGVFDNVAA